MSVVRVSFPMREDVWNKVVIDARELMSVAEELSDTFVVEYDNPESFNAAVARFDGMVEYTVQGLSPLQMIFDAADAHGEDTGEPDHTVGDLQDVLRAAWNLMSEAQREALMDSETVQSTLEMGGLSFDENEG